MVDASVIPFVVSGNTYMPTVLVAHKGVEAILLEVNAGEEVTQCTQENMNAT